MPSITTWNCPTNLPIPVIISTQEGLQAGFKPKRQLQAKACPQAWQALDDFVSSSQGPIVGYISYEMGACTSDLPRTYPHGQAPDLFFYEFEHLEPFDRGTFQSGSFHDQVTLKGRTDDFHSYAQKIEQIQQAIYRGDYYQVNLSQAFYFEAKHVDPFLLFQTLYLKNPAPYAAYIPMPDGAIISLSPELFVQTHEDRITVRPIKGTAPRQDDPHVDKQMALRLKLSAKDQSELLMITDLMRNDLTRLSLPNTIEVPVLAEVEAHRDVFHLVSTIQGQLRDETSPADILKTLFPSGSITGCPKIASMEAIANLEKRARGVYTGAIGVIYPDKSLQFNVAIRTLIMQHEQITVQLGGAILYDSDPEAEYLETLYKGKTFFEVLCGQPILMDATSQ